ncbi:aspartate/glutamate racemase family protein [Nocardioides hungaricus]|jgi:maleate isomerase
MSIGFGTRARVGHLYPSGGICDHEIQLMAPEGVQFVTTRVSFTRTGLADDRAMVDGVELAAALLADAAVDLVAFNCTAASMLAGPDEIRRRVAGATGGIPCVTTIEAVLAALASLDVVRVGLLDPYPAEVTNAEAAYLREHGFQVVDRGGPSCATPVEQGSVPPGTWIELADRLDLSQADAVLISCAGTQTADVIEVIERRTGRPVVTSNQALLWLVLSACNVPEAVPGYGVLLERVRGGWTAP